MTLVDRPAKRDGLPLPGPIETPLRLGEGLDVEAPLLAPGRAPHVERARQGELGGEDVVGVGDRGIPGVAHRDLPLSRKQHPLLQPRRSLAQHAEYLEASGTWLRSEEHTSELQSRVDLVCRLLLEKKKKRRRRHGYAARTHTNHSR